MTDIDAARRAENFPVASWLLPRDVRARARDFYAFARAADDVADAPALSASEKRARLAAMKPAADPLGPEARDLLRAFEQDVAKARYADWDELMAYCRLSAAPVGRYLVRVAGGGAAAWPATDALCAALQVLNHLQDCAQDYRRLDRVYLPRDWMAAAGATVDDLAQARTSPALRRVFDRMLDGVDGLLEQARPVHAAVGHPMLGREAAGIRAIAKRLSRALRRRDPLAGRVALAKPLAAWTFAAGALFPAGGGTDALARTGVRGSSFYWAMRILPAPKRDAMFALYAFCRAVDDIADGSGGPEEKRARLALWRADVEALFAGQPPSLAEVRALAGPVAAFGLAREDFLDLVSGMEQDAAGPVRMADMAELLDYCDKVAGTVGRSAGRIFGADPALGPRVAEHLGTALQLTNIVRDVAEDAARDRLYLPADLLARHGIAAGAPRAVLAHPALPEVLAALSAEAERRFASARAAMAACGRCMRPARVMMEVYSRLLGRLRRRAWAHVSRADGGRPRLSWPEKGWIVFRYGVLG
jgi:squalene synthase HpnD